MKFNSLALSCVVLVSTVFAGAAQGANPFAHAYKDTTNVLLYAKPTGGMITGRCNRYNSVFQTVRAKGGEVFAYLSAAAVPDNKTCTLDQGFYMGDAGKVPLWPYPTYGQRIMRPGNHMADLRAGSKWVLWVVSYVEKLMREGKVDGVWLDTIGGRPWPSTTEWSTWPLWEKNAWTDGSVDLVRRLDAKRRAINPNFIIVNNNTWDRSDKSTRGYVAHQYLDGVALEHPSGLTTYWKNYAGRTFNNLGHRRVYVIATTADAARAWAGVKGVTHVANQTNYAYPLAPPVGFRALTDRQ